MNDTIYRCLQSVNATEYELWLSGGVNERKSIDPKYKANREGKPQPVHREALKEAAVLEWNAKITDGIEADDALATEQSLSEYLGTTICSIDKDLMQVPGYHYNFVKDEHVLVSPLDGLRSFYRNLLIGDNADNITGVAGIGVVKAKRYIDLLDNEEEMFSVVSDLYDSRKRLLINCELMWLHRKEGEWFNKRPEFESLIGGIVFPDDDPEEI